MVDLVGHLLPTSQTFGNGSASHIASTYFFSILKIHLLVTVPKLSKESGH